VAASQLRRLGLRVASSERVDDALITGAPCLITEPTKCMRDVYVTGGPLGLQQWAMNGPGKPVLNDGEDVMLRHGDYWRWIWGDDLSAARAAGLKRGHGQSICIDNPTHIRATRLPADARARDALLARHFVRQTRAHSGAGRLTR
jgi:hypothetical protein